MGRISKISVIIPTRNKDLDLAKSALLSVDWADEILIADSSKNKLGEREVKKWAEENNAKFIHREYKYSADFKNWAIPQVKNDWILLLDSDEIVTKKLARTIQGILSSEKARKYDGFAIARKHFFFGKFLRFGGRYPLFNVRLFRKECRYEDRDVHAHIIIKNNRLGTIKPKEGDLLHFSDRNFNQFFERFDRYSTYQANYMKKIIDNKGEKVDWKQFFTNFIYFKAVIKDVWFFIPGSSLFRFLWMYILRLGFLDGRYGFTIAVLYAFQDYISKMKFNFLMERERSVWRNKLQKVLVLFVATILGDKEEFITSYKHNLSVEIRG